MFEMSDKLFGENLLPTEVTLTGWTHQNATVVTGGTKSSQAYRLSANGFMRKTVNIPEGTEAKSLQIYMNYKLPILATKATAFVKMVIGYSSNEEREFVLPLNHSFYRYLVGDIGGNLSPWAVIEEIIPMIKDGIPQTVTFEVMTTNTLPGYIYFDDIQLRPERMPSGGEFELQPGDVTENIIADNAVTSTKLRDLSVTNAKIANLAVNSAKISDAAITTAKIADANITRAKILDAAINTAKIDDAAIVNAKIANGTIENAKIADATITAAKIAFGTIDTARISDAAITRAKIEDAAIGTAQIGTASIINAHIQDLAVNSAKIADLAVTNAKIANGAIDNAKIGTAAIETANIKDAAITNAKIDRASVNKLVVETADIANAAITTAKIGDAQINNAKITNLAVTTAKIADAAIETAKIKDAAITNAKIDRASVNKLVVVTADIQDASITNAKIDALAVTAAKIADATITNAKIANGTIESAKIGDAQITTAKIATGAITTALLGDAQITTAKIADAQVTNAKIASLVAGKITSGTLDTALVTVQGANGKLRISGNRLQAFDNQATPVERVALGDVNGNGTVYGFRVRGEDGTTVLYDHTGVYNEGITDGAVTNPKIGDDAVDGRIIAADVVTANHILAGTITATEIAGNTITASKMVTGTITAASGILADAVITTAKIADAQITNAKIASIDAQKITTGVLDAGRIRIGSSTTFDPSYDPTTKETPTGAQAKATAAENSAKTHATTVAGTAETNAKNYADGQFGEAKELTTLWKYPGTTFIDGGDIYTNSVTANQIATGTITAASGILADAVITNAKIADLAVTGAKITDATITNAKIANLTIESGKIKDAAITTAKIGDAQITTAKIVDGNITNAKIGNLAVTDAKIANATISDAKIANISAEKITSGFISSDRIQAGTITAEKLSVRSGNLVHDVDSFEGYAVGDVVGGYKILGARGDVVAGGNFGTKCMRLRPQAGGDSATMYIFPKGGNGVLDGSDGWIKVHKGRRYIFSVYARTEHTVNHLVTARLLTRNGPTSTGTTGAGSSVTIFATPSVGRSSINASDGWVRLWGVYAPSMDINTEDPYVLLEANTYNLPNSDTAVYFDGFMLEEVNDGVTTPSAFSTAGITFISGDNITTGSITANKIMAGTITAASGIIADAAITNAKIANGSITDAKIASLSASKINAGTITGITISGNTITGGTITGTTITGSTITTVSSGSEVQLSGGTVRSHVPGTPSTFTELGYGRLTAQSSPGNFQELRSFSLVMNRAQENSRMELSAFYNAFRVGMPNTANDGFHFESTRVASYGYRDETTSAHIGASGGLTISQYGAGVSQEPIHHLGGRGPSYLGMSAGDHMIGINTRAPEELLDVRGTVSAGRGSASANFANLLKINSERAWVFMQEGSGSSAQLAFRSMTGSKIFRIQNSMGHNVAEFGAMSTSTNNYLNVGGQLNVSGHLYCTGSNWVYTSTLINDWSNLLYLRCNTEVRVTDPGGSNYRPVRASAFPEGSSILYKQNVKPFDADALSMVKDEQVFTYNLNAHIDEGIFDKVRVGFISEMVNPLMRDEDGVSVYSITSILWRAVQQQQAIIERYEERISNLEFAVNEVLMPQAA